MSAGPLVRCGCTRTRAEAPELPGVEALGLSASAVRALGPAKDFENLIQNLLAPEARENLSKICWLAQNLLARSQCSGCQALKSQIGIIGTIRYNR